MIHLKKLTMMLVALFAMTTGAWAQTVSVTEITTAGTELTWDNTTKEATFTMPAGNVELQVEYYPGMLVKPTNLENGKMEIEGVSETTLPEGFEKDEEGNIYVAEGTEFKVKITPAEGYHLVSLSDGTNNIEVDADGIATITMGKNDFELTAQFAENTYDVTLNAANALTIESGKATVKVGDDAVTPADGKISGLKKGQKVTINAANGYKFKKVEAKSTAE